MLIMKNQMEVKKMKKTIAFVLAMLMVLSAAPIAFAEDDVNATADGNETVEPEEPVVGGPEVEENETEEPEVEEPEVEDGTEGNETEVEIEGNETEEPEFEIEIEVEGNETELEIEGNETEVGGNETEEEEELEVPEEVAEEAGITPDSPLYGLERAMERISLAFTLGKSAKAKKGLRHAQERLAEVQAMIAAKRMAKAQVAQEAHDEIMEEVEENVAGLGDGDTLAELTDEVELEQAMEQHEEAVQATNRMKVKLKGLTAEEESQVNAILGNLSESGSKVKAQIKVKKDKTKIKVKAKEGYTDEQIDSVVGQIGEAVSKGKKVQVVLPGRGNGKNKNKGGDGLESESEDEEDEEEEEIEIEIEDEDEDGMNATSAPKNNKGKPKKDKNK